MLNPGLGVCCCLAPGLGGMRGPIPKQALRSLRAALRPLPLSVGVDLVVVGEEDAHRLAGSRWHVVARALREGKELAERHLGSLKGTLDPATFANEDWGFSGATDPGDAAQGVAGAPLPGTSP
jgi:hypothetical protein